MARPPVVRNEEISDYEATVSAMSMKRIYSNDIILRFVSAMASCGSPGSQSISPLPPNSAVTLYVLAGAKMAGQVKRGSSMSHSNRRPWVTTKSPDVEARS